MISGFFFQQGWGRGADTAYFFFLLGNGAMELQKRLLTKEMKTAVEGVAGVRRHRYRGPRQQVDQKVKGIGLIGM